jgi:hypothetical protein
LRLLAEGSCLGVALAPTAGDFLPRECNDLAVGGPADEAAPEREPTEGAPEAPFEGVTSGDGAASREPEPPVRTDMDMPKEEGEESSHEMMRESLACDRMSEAAGEAGSESSLSVFRSCL